MSARQLSNNGVPIPRYFTPLLHVQLSYIIFTIAKETYWNYTSFTSAMVFENVLQLDPNRAPPQLTKKNCILHPLRRSQACERFKMVDIPTQLANSCWLKYWNRRPGELIFGTFCSCSTIKAHFCHLRKLLEKYPKKYKQDKWLHASNASNISWCFIFWAHTKHLQLWF